MSGDSIWANLITVSVGLVLIGIAVVMAATIALIWVGYLTWRLIRRLWHRPARVMRRCKYGPALEQVPQRRCDGDYGCWHDGDGGAWVPCLIHDTPDPGDDLHQWDTEASRWHTRPLTWWRMAALRRRSVRQARRKEMSQ